MGTIEDVYQTPFWLQGNLESKKATASKNKRQDTTQNKYLNFVDYIIQEIKKAKSLYIYIANNTLFKKNSDFF